MKKAFKYLLVSFPLAALLLLGCSKSNYEDGGTTNRKFNGHTVAYLESKPVNNKALLEIINLAGFKNALQTENLTFFAPSAPCIERTIRELNELLFSTGRDTVVKLSQIKPEVWRWALGNYIFKEKRSLVDYPQVDLSNKIVFPGQTFESYTGRFMNIGVEYGNASGIQYAGYRNLVLSYPVSQTDLGGFWLNGRVASSDIETNNGFVHVIAEYETSLNQFYVEPHYFGFNLVDFVNMALDYGIGNP